MPVKQAGGGDEADFVFGLVGCGLVHNLVYSFWLAAVYLILAKIRKSSQPHSNQPFAIYTSKVTWQKIRCFIAMPCGQASSGKRINFCTVVRRATLEERPRSVCRCRRELFMTDAGLGLLRWL